MKISVGRKEAVWSILGTSLSMMANFIVLPFILYFMDDESIGLYYVMTSLSSIATLFDFGFSPALSRSMAYAWSGSERLCTQGAEQNENTEPNYVLMYRIIKSCKLIYGVLSGVALILAVFGGTVYINSITKDFEGNSHIVAWLVYAFAIFFNLLYGFYSVFLRGVGAVDKVNIATVLARIIQILICIVLLYLGIGLLGVAIAYIAYGFSFRILAKHWFYKHENIGDIFRGLGIKARDLNIREILQTIWPNTWRDGVVTISNYLLNQATTIIASLYFSLYQTGIYSLAFQLTTAIATISMSLYNSYQPALQSAHATGDKSTTKRYLSAGIVSFIGVFVLGILFLLLLGEPILSIIRPSYVIDKLLIVATASCQFIQCYRNCYTSYLSCTNRLIYTKAFVASSILCVFLSLFFVAGLRWGIYGLVIGQFLSQVVFNAWYWPRYVRNELNLGIRTIVALGMRELYTMIKREKR